MSGNQAMLFLPKTLARAIALWWREFAFLLLLNFIWLLAQVTIVFGPPATAALAAIADRVADGELIDFRDFWEALRANFGAAWRWASGCWRGRPRCWPGHCRAQRRRWPGWGGTRWPITCCTSR